MIHIVHKYIEPEKLKYFARFFHGLQHCKNLSELTLPMAFGDYANYTSNVKKLEVLGNCEFSLEDMDWIENFERLEILKVEFLKFEDKEINIKDFTLKMFGKLTHLKILELDDCSLMYEPDFLMNIHEVIPSLETLIMITKGIDDGFPLNIENLVDVLDSIGNVRNLNIKDTSDFRAPFYLLNNKDFNRILPNNLDEDQIRDIFHTAFDIINKKFSIDLTSLEILDSKYGWFIKKDKEKPPTLSQLPFKCKKEDCDDITCIEFFADKANWEYHEESGFHRFPNCYL